jgi:hypothetical protein
MKKLKAIQILIGKIEKFKFCHRGPDGPIQEFWRFYETELGVPPMRECHQNIFLYHNENLQKNLRSRSNCFRDPNRCHTLF